MKIRNGFVSNSSSSSFICDTKLSVEEVKELLEKMVYFFNEMFKDCDESSYMKYAFSKPFDEMFGSVKKLTRKDINTWNKDYGEYYGKWDDSYIGKINIRGRSDNSIPSDIFDLIERRFEACRIHLEIGRAHV